MNRARRLVIGTFALLLAPNVLAGHGLMNAFADLEPLPTPSRTPDQWSYRVAVWHERAQLYLSPVGAARFALCLDLTREKAAAAEAMIRRAANAAALVAIEEYRDYLRCATASIEQAALTERPVLRERFAKALLEQQYLVSIDYLDLPRATRGLLAQIIDVASKTYTAVRALLPPATAAAAFFKEDEVRWSWEMAQRADQQNL